MNGSHRVGSLGSCTRKCRLHRRNRWRVVDRRKRCRQRAPSMAQSACRRLRKDCWYGGGTVFQSLGLVRQQGGKLLLKASHSLSGFECEDHGRSSLNAKESLDYGISPSCWTGKLMMGNPFNFILLFKLLTSTNIFFPPDTPN